MPRLTAVITDVHYRMSLALIRELARSGVRVVCCERENVSAPLGFVSKSTSRSVTLPAEGYMDKLFELCSGLAQSEGERPALLPVGATTLALLAKDETRCRFRDVAGLCIPTPEQLDLLNDKTRVANLAQENCIPVPRNFSMPQGEFPDSRLLPLVIKPQCGERLGLPAAKRYVIARTPGEAHEAFLHFSELAGEPPVVQEYIPGSGLGCSVLASEGEIISYICHRRVREYPVSGGPSSCCDVIERPDLVKYARRLVGTVGLTGLAMLEFKEDAQGKPRLLEVNPRVWGTFPLTRAAKSPIPLLWCLLAWNQGNPQKAVTLPEVRAPRRCRMRFAASDIMSAVGYIKTGKPRRAAGAFLDLIRLSVKDGLWEWRDIRPGLMYYRSLLRKDKP